MTRTKCLLLGVGLFFLGGAALLQAGDCSDPSDCTAIPDNVTRGAVVLSVFAGAGLAFRSQDNQSDGSDSNGEAEADEGDGSDSGSEGDEGPEGPEV